MKNIVSAEKLVGFLNQKNSTDVKFRKDSLVERKEMFLDKVESINEEEGTCQCIITTQGTDRQGDVVITNGIDTTEFTKIPSVFLNHDYSLLPIAKCLELTHKDGYIMAKVEFVLSVPVIKNIFELVKAGVLKGVSIGFAANEVVLRGTKAFEDVCRELRLDAQTYEKTQRIIKSWTMYEFSIVSIPANSECYIKSLSDSKITVDPELVKYLGVKNIIIKTEDTPDAVAKGIEDTPDEEEDPFEESAKNIEVIKEKALEPEVIEIKPHVKRYIEVIKTPEEVEEYINKCVEARIKGKTRIVII